MKCKGSAFLKKMILKIIKSENFGVQQARKVKNIKKDSRSYESSLISIVHPVK